MEKPRDMLWRGETQTVGSQANELPHFGFQKEEVNPGIQRLGSDGEESSEKVELHRQEIIVSIAER